MKNAEHAEKVRARQMMEALEADSNDSWAMVELYRWQHGELPPQDAQSCKPLDVPTALRKMAESFAQPDSSKWPDPVNGVPSVLSYAAKLLDEKPKCPRCNSMLRGGICLNYGCERDAR